MRTQKLLVAVATLAVGIATSMAQVYSQNIVGYVNVPVNTGFNLIANPLTAATNTLSSLFPNASIGDTIYKYNGSGFDSSVYFGFWSPDMTLIPGEGVFYNNGGASNTVTFTGTVSTGSLTNDIPAGFSIRSSQVPQSDTLENMGFPAQIGDTIYFYRNGGYVSSVYFGFFSPAAQPAVGEAFWVNTTAGASWTRTFNP